MSKKSVTILALFVVALSAGVVYAGPNIPISHQFANFNTRSVTETSLQATNKALVEAAGLFETSHDGMNLVPPALDGTEVLVINELTMTSEMWLKMATGMMEQAWDYFDAGSYSKAIEQAASVEQIVKSLENYVD